MSASADTAERRITSSEILVNKDISMRQTAETFLYTIDHVSHTNANRPHEGLHRTGIEAVRVEEC